MVNVRTKFARAIIFCVLLGAAQWVSAEEFEETEQPRNVLMSEASYGVLELGIARGLADDDLRFQEGIVFGRVNSRHGGGLYIGGGLYQDFSSDYSAKATLQYRYYGFTGNDDLEIDVKEWLVELVAKKQLDRYLSLGLGASLNFGSEYDFTDNGFQHSFELESRPGFLAEFQWRSMVVKYSYRVLDSGVDTAKAQEIRFGYSKAFGR